MQGVFDGRGAMDSIAPSHPDMIIHSRPDSGSESNTSMDRAATLVAPSS
jgi:hypothetical protein